MYLIILTLILSCVMTLALSLTRQASILSQTLKTVCMHPQAQEAQTVLKGNVPNHPI